jgi:hypothetical protein
MYLLLILSDWEDVIAKFAELYFGSFACSKREMPINIIAHK